MVRRLSSITPRLGGLQVVLKWFTCRATKTQVHGAPTCKRGTVFEYRVDITRWLQQRECSYRQFRCLERGNWGNRKISLRTALFVHSSLFFLLTFSPFFCSNIVTSIKCIILRLCPIYEHYPQSVRSITAVIIIAIHRLHVNCTSRQTVAPSRHRIYGTESNAVIIVFTFVHFIQMVR
jgi:hypothetical protein